MRRRYSGTNRYTAAILGYVLGAGTLMTVAAPNFGGLLKKQQALEGAYRHLQASGCCTAGPRGAYRHLQASGCCTASGREGGWAGGWGGPRHLLARGCCTQSWVLHAICTRRAPTLQVPGSDSSAFTTR